MSDNLKYAVACALVVLSLLAEYASAATAVSLGGPAAAVLFGILLSLLPAGLAFVFANRGGATLELALIGGCVLLAYLSGALTIVTMGWGGCVLFAFFWVFVPVIAAVALVMAGLALVAPAAKAAGGATAAAGALGMFSSRSTAPGQITGSGPTTTTDPWA